MDFDSEISLDHLLFTERKCRVCGETKDLVQEFYVTRKNRTTLSSYSYECKVCTIQRIVKNRKNQAFSDWIYPDW